MSLAEGDSAQVSDGLVQENGGGPDVLSASELADGDGGSRSVITGARAYRRSPSKDNAYSAALRKALTKDRHQARSGKGRGAAKKGTQSNFRLLKQTEDIYITRHKLISCVLHW